MSILQRFKDRLRRSLTVVPYQLWRHHAGGISGSGIQVNESTALSASAVFAAVRAISEDVAVAPIHVYRHLKPRGKERLHDHWLVNLLESPCPEMTDFDLRSCMVACALLFGNSYAEIERANNGLPLRLWPIEPWRVQLLRDQGGELYYHIVDSGVKVKPENMLHIKGFTLTGILGEMLIRYAKDSLGLILGAEMYASKWFANASTPSGYIEAPGSITPEAAQQLSDGWAAAQAGLANTGKAAVLYGGRKFVPLTTVEPEKSQLLQTRMFNVSEVCRWFRVPPTKLFDYGRATWSNSEQASLDYLGDSLGPWFVRIEREAKRKLTTPDMGLYVRHDPDERTLRSDSLTKTQVQSLQVRSGIKTLDEIREANDDNDIPNGMGQKLFIPKDMQTLDQLFQVEAADDAETSPTEDTPPEDATDGVTPESEPTATNPTVNPTGATKPVGSGLGFNSLRSLAEINGRQLADVLRRTLHTETDKVLRQAKKGNLFPWADEFYTQHEQFVRSVIEAPIRAFIDSAIAVTGDVRLIEEKSRLVGMVSVFAKRHVDQSLSDLKDPDGLHERVSGWMDHRTNLLATQAMDEILDAVKGVGE